MARKPYKMIFGDKEKLETMLDLRRVGWTYMSLALLYGVDYSSIYHQCNKFHVRRRNNAVDFSVRSILNEIGVEVKKIKSYEDYLRESGYKSQKNRKTISV